MENFMQHDHRKLFISLTIITIAVKVTSSAGLVFAPENMKFKFILFDLIYQGIVCFTSLILLFMSKNKPVHKSVAMVCFFSLFFFPSSVSLICVL